MADFKPNLSDIMVSNIKTRYILNYCKQRNGRIRHRFGRKAGILKSPKKNYRWFNAFLNPIQFLIFLITGKWVYFNFIAFCFFRMWFWTWQHDPFHTKIDKFGFGFKECFCLWVFSPRIRNVLWMRFSAEFTASILKKMERWPRNN